MYCSLTYQQLPDWILLPLLDGHLTVSQASDLWDQWLMAPEDQVTPLPERLWGAVQALQLLDQEASLTRH